MLRNNFMSHFLFSHITCLKHFSKSGEHVTSIGISAFKSPFKFQIIIFCSYELSNMLCFAIRGLVCNFCFILLVLMSIVNLLNV